MNSIKVTSIKINTNRIDFDYDIKGDWKEAFNQNEPFFAEYSCDVSNVPESIAVIPFVANLLPLSWIYDAEIYVPTCDEDFYSSIAEFKKGYETMYPMIKFGGKIVAEKTEKNIVNNQENVASFFSGGVDAFNTLTQHWNEKPTLIEMWGADISFEDVAGWNNVLLHLRQISDEFDVASVTVKSSLRRFIKDDFLHNKVYAICGDGWWHGFQHGLGIYCHAAPIAYALGLQKVYFASSFTAADKGKVTCASDPTIDNFVRFCGCNMVHDGYEFTRQMKIHNIAQFSRKNGKHISLRVCWESSGGSNCCNCEKCWRTMLGIYAEGFDPHDFGFEYDDNKLKHISKKMRYSHSKLFRISTYKLIQDAMKKNIKKTDLPVQIRWFYSADIIKLNSVPIYMKVIRKIRSLAGRIKRRAIK